MVVVGWLILALFTVLNFVNGVAIYIWLTRQAWGL